MIPGITLLPFSFSTLIVIPGMLVLLCLTIAVSAAESAFFALDPKDIEDLKSTSNKTDKLILDLIDRPKRLLATLLISLNFVNIAIVILSTFLMNRLFDFTHNPHLGFFLQVVVVTFLILVTGEIIPKVYAIQHPLSTARLLIIPTLFFEKAFYPISSFLIFITSSIENKVKFKSHSLSVKELTHALELTSKTKNQADDQKILQGIVKFGDTDVKQIMRSRIDVTAFEYNLPYHELLQKIQESVYSRIPVYKESFDQVVGVLYIKDVLPYLDTPDFEWQKLLRSPFFVPESKKIDDLLWEFKKNKIHLAVVVDEYGGTSGIVTLEDILEEIIGEINDEFDEDELVYSRLDDKNFVFEGKVHLKDIYRVLNIDGTPFEESKGEADTLAGFLIEREGRILTKGEKVDFNNYSFTIEAADMRKIKRVKITLLMLIIFGMFFTSCNSDGDDLKPKPRGYLRIDLPEKTYTTYSGDCPFTFEVPTYAFVHQDENKNSQPCWLNIDFPRFKGRIHLTYKPVHNDLRQFLEDAYDLASKHQLKASAINELPIDRDSSKVYGLVYDIEGNAASSLQFYLTDSTHHYLRGALYFMSPPNADSIAPVVEFIRKDVFRMIATLKWK